MHTFIDLFTLSFKKVLRIVGVCLSAACCIAKRDSENVIARTVRIDAPSVIKRDEKKPVELPIVSTFNLEKYALI